MKIVFSFLCMSMVLFSQSINEQIHALEDATPEKRVELMNHIKEQLIAMNHEERMKTIRTLQKELQKKHTYQHNRNQNYKSKIDDKRVKPSERQEQMREDHQRDSKLHQGLHQHNRNKHKSSHHGRK